MTFYTQWTFFPAKIIIVSLVSILLVLLASKTSASRRHVLAVAGLVAMLVLPWMGFFVPSRQVSLPYAAATKISYIANAPYGIANSMGLTGKTYAYSPPSSLVSVFQYTPLVETYGWLLVFLLLLGKVGLGYRRVLQWKRRGTPFGDGGVFLSDDAAVPMTTCLVKPTIFLPREAAGWELARLERVLQHERAHMKRRDCLWNLVGQVTCAFYWPLPTVWILQRMAKSAAEQACDDLVLRAGNKPAEYAQDLLDAARHLTNRWPSPVLPLVTKSEVASRIKRVLDKRVNRASAGLATLGFAAVLALGITVPLASARIISNDAPWTLQPLSGQLPAGSPGSVAGTSNNGFVGTLPDGRKVKLLQITHLGDHGVEAWKPDGTLIPNPDVYGAKTTWWLSTPTRIQLIFQYHSTAPDRATTLEIMPTYDIPGEATGEMMSIGRVLPLSSGDLKFASEDIDLLQSRAKTGSYVFALGDGKWRETGVVIVHPDGSSSITNHVIKDLAFEGSKTIVSATMGHDGHMHQGPGIVLDRTLPPNSQAPCITFQGMDRLNTDVRVRTVDRHGKVRDEMPVRSEFTTGSAETHWSSVPLAQLARFEIDVRPIEMVGFRTVHVRPNRP